MGYEKLLPEVDADNKEFWERVKKHEFAIPKCSDCGRLRYPPRVICPECLSEKYEWAPIKGTGKVYTFVDMHVVSHPQFAAEAPYNLSIVALDEGVRVWSNVINCTVEEVYIGMPVRIVYEDITDDFALAKFEPLPQ